MEPEIRAATDDEGDLLRTVVNRGFGEDPEPGDEVAEASRATIELDRSRVAYNEHGTMVGTSGAYTFELTVPGSTVGMAGLTAVTVAPTHRRRGLLTRMINAHFDDAEDRGEPVSGLLASETPIYGRYGYGPAVLHHRVTVDTNAAAIRSPEPRDDLALMEPEQLWPLARELYDRVRPTIPGMLSRSEVWWEYRHALDLPASRNGASSNRFAVASRGGGPVGYAVYRQKPSWNHRGLPQGEVIVREVIAVDQQAAHSLWSLLCSIDLFPVVSVWALPLDAPLPWLAGNLRAVERTATDHLWLRLLHVGRAIEARRYRAAGAVTFAVTDRHRPANQGVHRLEIDGDGTARCQLVESPAGNGPALTLDVAALGSLYLGAGSATQLVSSGLATGDVGAIADLVELFRWPVAPWSPEGF